MSTTGTGTSPSRAAAHLADEQVSGDAVPNSPFLGLLHANPVGQFLHGLVRYVGEPYPSQHVDYFFSAVLVLCQDNLRAEEELLRPTLERLRLPSRSRRWATRPASRPAGRLRGWARVKSTTLPATGHSGLLARSRPGAVTTRDRTAEVPGQDRGSKAARGRAGRVARRTFPSFVYETAPGILARPDCGSTAA